MDRVLKSYLIGRQAGDLDSPGFESSWVGGLSILLLSLAFLTLKFYDQGIYPIHLMFVAAFVGLYFLHPLTRRFLVIALPVAGYAIIYDFFRYVPFSWLQPIHVTGPYNFDLHWFGLMDHGQLLHLNQWVFQKFANPLFDFASGILYFLHVPMAVAMLFLLWRFRTSKVAERYAFAFFLMNVWAFITYLVFPAAAPWYVEKYGFLQPLAPVMGDAAGLKRFDALLGIHVFSQNYQISPVTFGAIPSMHIGVATLVCLYSFKLGKKWGVLFSLYLLGMVFSALYLNHHYFIDLLVGALYAVLAWLLCEHALKKPLVRLYQHLSYWTGLSKDSNQG